MDPGFKPCRQPSAEIIAMFATIDSSAYVKSCPRGVIVDSFDSTAPRALIADDQPDVLEALRLLLKGEGYQIEAVTSPAAIIKTLNAQDFDLLLMDLNYARDTTSGQEGLDLLASIQAIDGTLPIVVMTAWSTVGLAVEAMRRGVRDFVQKPWDNANLLTTLRTEIEQGRVRRRQQRQAEQELADARETERGLLPNSIPHLPGYEVSGAWQPAGAVGGDYFDILKFSNRHAALCIADVMGKGVPAALLMSNLQAAVRAVASEFLAPQELCVRVNRAVSSNLALGKFITFFYCLLDLERKVLTYTNAGHGAPVLLHQDGSLVRFHQGGPVLGLDSERAYAQGEVQLASGDRLLLFTDGVTEGLNAQEEEFGEERLIHLLRDHRERNANELQKRILGAVGEFTGGRVHDDATLVILAVL